MGLSILMVDPNAQLAHDLIPYLASEAFTLTCAHDGETGLKKALNQSFDAIILDIMLPKLNGFDVLKTIRAQLDTPILILTARHDDIDRIVGFELGADDYLLKPCSPHELVARLHAITRRAHKSPSRRTIITHHHITVDCAKRLAYAAGIKLELTNTEFNILEMLIKSPGQAFSKEELTEYALGRKYTAYDRSIDVHISNLRNKLGDNQTSEALITTVRGFGYVCNS